MPLIAEELLIKLMAIGAFGGTVAGGSVALNNYVQGSKPERMEGRKVGLECGRDGFCYLYGGNKVTVKQDNETRTLSSTEKGGNIKINNRVTKGGGENGFFFSIEDGDIALEKVDVGDGVSRADKLEEFETYEIDKETVEGKERHFLRRRTRAGDEIRGQLGLGDCELPTDERGVTCTLDEGKLKAINFDGKEEDSTMAGEGGLSLTITGVSDIERRKAGSVKYPLGYIFELSGQKAVTIPTKDGDITKRANETIEFKIKKDGRKLSLERVGNVERLSRKLELDCRGKTCKFPSVINVYRDEGNSVTMAEVTDHSKQSITFEENVGGYNGRVKFTLNSAVAITGGNKKGTVDTIEPGNYEIKEQTVDGNRSWYLSMRAAA